MTLPNTLSGVIAAVPTPLAGRSADRDRFTAHARWALENGCDGLNVLGSTGEATSFAPEERAELMRHAARTLPLDRMMVGTGAPDLATAIRLTSLAGECGFSGALVLPPYYYTGVSDDGLFAFFDALIRETAETAPRIYLYNFPQMTGIAFSVALARRLKAAHPERIAGAKDSSGKLDYAEELAQIEDFDVFPSNEAALSVAREKGFAGIISATVNVSAPVAGRVWNDPSDSASAGFMNRVRAEISAQVLVPAVKYMVGLRQGDSAWEAVLPPMIPLGPSGKTALNPLWSEISQA